MLWGLSAERLTDQAGVFHEKSPPNEFPIAEDLDLPGGGRHLVKRPGHDGTERLALPFVSIAPVGWDCHTPLC